MTTFEVTIIVLLAAIVVLLIVLLRTAIEGFHGVWQNQDTMYQDIQRIEVNTHHAFSVLQDNLAPDVETLSNNFQYLLDGKKGVPALFDEVCQTNARIDGFIPMLKKLLEHNESIENFWASDSSLVIKLLKELVDIEHKSDERNDKAYFNGLLERLDNMTDEGGTLQQQLNALAINVKGNYNTLEQQQETIGYIKMRVNHILSLMHPPKEIIKLDAPTALDGLTNVQKDNANKSTNYKGYDPTIIVRGSETTDKEN